jgi:DNA-binding NarL/FixJ family response regulator
VERQQATALHQKEATHERAVPVRVVIVDDHPMVRMGLSMTLLSTGEIAVVGEADDGEEGLRVCADLHPDVVLMDLRLPSPACSC